MMRKRATKQKPESFISLRNLISLKDMILGFGENVLWNCDKIERRS